MEVGDQSEELDPEASRYSAKGALIFGLRKVH